MCLYHTDVYIVLFQMLELVEFLKNVYLFKGWLYKMLPYDSFLIQMKSSL